MTAHSFYEGKFEKPRRRRGCLGAAVQWVIAPLLGFALGLLFRGRDGS